MQFYAFVALAAAYFPAWMQSVQAALRMGLRQAFPLALAPDILTPTDMIAIMLRLSNAVLRPLAILGLVLLAITILFQMASTNVGFSLARLAPNFNRLNTFRRLKDMPGKQHGRRSFRQW